ncbi:hypothetical protein AAG906_032891 [Vitis piasezkii]
MERISILGFIVAILYFITMELACNGYTHIGNNIQSEQETLIDFKSGLKDPNNRLSSWKGSNYCSNVYENWSSMKLSGEIRPSLTKLKSLKYLDLSFNSFKGMPIPQFFGLEFSGTIPSNFGNLSNLQYFDLSYGDSSYDDFEYFNDLSIGNIEWMASLVSLKYLGMDYVNLSSVGSEWVEVLNKLPILTELHLDGCSLSGSIPSPSFVNFTSLLHLGSINIRYNQLHGRIPLGLGELPNLQYLYLFGNHLEGSISQLLRKSWKR